MFEVVGQFFDVVGSDGARVAEIHEGNPISDATWKKLRVFNSPFCYFYDTYVSARTTYVKLCFSSFLHLNSRKTF